MTHRDRAHVSALWIVLLTCSGCANSLPRYSWSGADPAIETMTRRDLGLNTFSATCRLLLRADGGDVELSGVLVARPPSHLHLRASKLMQTVFDITLTPDGLFVYSKDRGENGSKTAQPMTRDGLIDAASLLPGFSPQASWQIGGGANERHFSRTRKVGDGEHAVTCSVEKITLTTTRCDYLDEAGTVRQSIAFDDYRTFGEIVWPMHVTGVGRGGSFEILFNDVEINPDLPSRAFVPSRRAVKKP